MADNTITSPDAVGKVERYLEKSLLAEREFNTPLAQAPFSSKMNLPKMAGQYIKFTRRTKMRLPEVASETADPLSGASIQYEQINVPVEFINDYISISTMAQMTSWLDLAKDGKELSIEALRRYQNRAIQAAILLGRAQPGKRNSSGVTTGVSPYFNFWAASETTVTLYGQSFTFLACPRYYAARRTAWGQVTANDRVKMSDFRRVRTLLENAGAPKINGKYAATISYAVQMDLEADDEYFQQAIRNAQGQSGLMKGQIADYAGIHWILEDEPWTLALGGSADAFVSGGAVHVSHVFGQDAYGYMRLGGENSAKPKFKVQDVSKVGNTTTIGYMVPFQAAVLNRTWAASLISPVSEPAANA